MVAAKTRYRRAFAATITQPRYSAQTLEGIVNINITILVGKYEYTMLKDGKEVNRMGIIVRAYPSSSAAVEGAKSMQAGFYAEKQNGRRFPKDSKWLGMQFYDADGELARED